MAHIPPFDPGTYPGPRPSAPVLVHRGRLWPLTVDGTVDAPVRLAADPYVCDDLDEPTVGSDATEPSACDDLGGRAGARTPPDPGDVPVLARPGSVRYSVAYGSNASPARLVDKGLDHDGAILLPARLTGYVPAFEGRRTGYCAVPVTFVPAEGVHLDTWVLGVPAAATPQLDRSEGRAEDPHGVADPVVVHHHHHHARHAPAGSYRLAPVGEVAVADRFRLPVGLAYRPGPSTRVQVDDHGEPRTWPRVDQRQAVAHLERDGPLQEVPAVEDAVEGPWPTTPLEDLPLFVYGSLRPGAAAWSVIADAVEVVTDATTEGRLHDSGHGWPAARFGPHADAAATGQVHGSLLAVRHPAVAPRVLAQVDAYEGVPERFHRTAVRVHTADGSRWAIAYTWAGTTLPGAPLPEGRWRG